MTGSAKGAVLVTGGAGFIGCNLVDRLASDGCNVIILDNLSRAGADRNADWLLKRHGERISLIRADIRDRDAVGRAVGRADAVFHLAAQVAVTTSLVTPLDDFGVNVEGTVLLLEAIRARRCPTPLIFASTNKVYGALADIALEAGSAGYMPADPVVRSTGISEARPLSFCTPYGCSKGAADQYVLDYAHSFGIPTAVLRMSCIYGPHQMGNEDQGWVAHFLIRALRGEPITVFGDGNQVRDILYVEDAVTAYISAWRRAAELPGRVFNLGGGPANAVSLNLLLSHIEQLMGRRPSVVSQDWRPGDQRYYVSDTARAGRELAWSPRVPWREGVARLLDWLRTAANSPARTSSCAEAAE